MISARLPAAVALAGVLLASSAQAQQPSIS